jgi:hypothetical protein
MIVQGITWVGTMERYRWYTLLPYETFVFGRALPVTTINLRMPVWEQALRRSRGWMDWRR